MNDKLDQWSLRNDDVGSKKVQIQIQFIELVARRLNKQWSTVQQDDTIQEKKWNAMQCDEKLNQGEWYGEYSRVKSCINEIV